MILHNPERRHDTRIQINETGFLESVDKKGTTIPVRVTDVSFQGLGLLANRIIEANRDFVVKYSILLRGFKYPVKIKWTSQSSTGYAIGCRKK